MAKEINLRPLDDRVVVEPMEAEEMTAGGIVLPDTAKEKPQRGTVLAVGPGQAARQRRARQALGGRRRRSDLRQVQRQRNRSRRPRSQDPPRNRHPGQDREVNKAGLGLGLGLDCCGHRHESSSPNPDPQPQALNKERQRAKTTPICTARPRTDAPRRG